MSKNKKGDQKTNEKRNKGSLEKLNKIKKDEYLMDERINELMN